MREPLADDGCDGADTGLGGAPHTQVTRQLHGSNTFACATSCHSSVSLISPFHTLKACMPPRPSKRLSNAEGHSSANQERVTRCQKGGARE